MKDHQSVLHPATAKLVADFAEALAQKLAAAEQKYGYSDGWASGDWMDECRAKLREHLDKGDPRDVAAYCAFLWFHHEPTVVEGHQTPIDRVRALISDKMRNEYTATEILAALEGDKS